MLFQEGDVVECTGASCTGVTVGQEYLLGQNPGFGEGPGWTDDFGRPRCAGDAAKEVVGCFRLVERDGVRIPVQPPADEPDMVNSPPHYTQGGIETIDAIRAALTPEEFRGYCKGNAFKYLWRERHKGGDESLAKARWYLVQLLEQGS